MKEEVKRLLGYIKAYAEEVIENIEKAEVINGDVDGYGSLEDIFDEVESLADTMRRYAKDGQYECRVCIFETVENEDE